MLLPNGGDAAVENGVEWGFHGEAGVVEWKVDEVEPQAAVCSTALITAPLEVVRRVSLMRNVLRVEEQVTNLGSDAIEVMWGHHPTFGAPFLGPGCTVETSARTFTADDRAPGNGLAPGGRSTWPNAALDDGGQIDLSTIPGPDERRAVLGYLSDFEHGSYRIVNSRLGHRPRTQHDGACAGHRHCPREGRRNAAPLAENSSGRHARGDPPPRLTWREAAT